MAAATGGWRVGLFRRGRTAAFLMSFRHASSSAASPCIATTLYEPTRKGPPTDEMLTFMEKLRSFGGSSGAVRRLADRKAFPLLLAPRTPLPHLSLSPLLFSSFLDRAQAQ